MEHQVKTQLSFDDFKLSKPLRKALEDLDIVYPTPIQIDTFPLIMAGKNVVGIAQTGTGKTLAYLLPVLQSLPYQDTRDPRVLILVPTRELVMQVLETIEQLTEFISLRVLGIYGGSNINTQKEQVFQGCDILVATPGRLLDINLTGVLKFKNIKKLIIDEVDEMLNLGFFPQISAILERIPDKRQNLLFSATMLPEVSVLIDDFLGFYETVQVVPHGTPLEQIEQAYFNVPNFHTKINLLKFMLINDQSLEKVLIFIESKRLADYLFDALPPEIQLQTGVIHSNKSQNFRFRMVDEFEQGQIKFLIATNILARGLDIQKITHVINFDMPKTPEEYIHRIGRTGRKDEDGFAVSFVKLSEMEYLQAAESFMNMEIDVWTMPEEVEISSQLIEDEKEQIVQKNFVKIPSIKQSGGNFHEKSDKNKKVNLGGPGAKAKLLKKKRK